MSGRSIRIGVAAAVAGIALLAGGLIFGGALVSAQTPPSPTPQEQQTTPATPQDQTPAPDNQTPGQPGTHDKADCPGMNGDSGSGSGPTSSGASDGYGGAGFHGRAPGGMRS
jgi:hypothetical protein